jgi:hypothetical protein
VIPKWLEAWHFVALGVGMIFYGAVRSLVRKGLSWDWSGPPEDYAPMTPETECDPTPKPGVVAFKNFVLTNFGGTDMGIIRECGGRNSGHTAGAAWDWGTLSGDAQVDELLELLADNDNELVKRTGLMYFIWNRQIWNTRSRVWQNYTGPSPHTDHVHFSFGPQGAWGRTSFFTEGPKGQLA